MDVRPPGSVSPFWSARPSVGLGPRVPANSWLGRGGGRRILCPCDCSAHHCAPSSGRPRGRFRSGAICSSTRGRLWSLVDAAARLWQRGPWARIGAGVSPLVWLSFSVSRACACAGVSVVAGFFGGCRSAAPLYLSARAPAPPRARRGGSGVVVMGRRAQLLLAAVGVRQSSAPNCPMRRFHPPADAAFRFGWPWAMAPAGGGRPCSGPRGGHQGTDRDADGCARSPQGGDCECGCVRAGRRGMSIWSEDFRACRRQLPRFSVVLARLRHGGSRAPPHAPCRRRVDGCQCRCAPVG